MESSLASSAWKYYSLASRCLQIMLPWELIHSLRLQHISCESMCCCYRSIYQSWGEGFKLWPWHHAWLKMLTHASMRLLVHLQSTLLVCSRLLIKLSAQKHTNTGRKFTSDHGNILFYPCWDCLLEHSFSQLSHSTHRHQEALTFCRLQTRTAYMSSKVFIWLTGWKMPLCLNHWHWSHTI